MKRHNINHGEADHMNTQYYLADEVDAELERYETARQEDARRLKQVKGELEAMRDALEPFAHPDLCEYLPSNKDGGNSPLFQRNKAVITINDCRQAAAALKDAK